MHPVETWYQRSHPIQRVPTEVLEKILLRALPPWLARPSSRDAPLHLTHVCKRWRSVVQTCPDFWRTLHVDVSVMTPVDLGLFTSWLTRSRALTIAVELDHRASAPSHVTLMAVAELANHSDRWRQVDLYLPASIYLPGGPFTRAYHRMGQLRAVRIACRTGRTVNMDLFEFAPSLEEVNLGEDVYDPVLPYQQLRRLLWEPKSCASYVRVSNAAGNVRNLKMCISAHLPEWDSSSSAQCSNPSVRFLIAELEDSDVLGDIFGRSTFRNLVAMQVVLDSEEVWPASTFHSFISRCNQLVALNLTVSMATHEVFRLFHELHTVETLKFNGRPILQDAAVNALMVSPEGLLLLPRLKQLVISEDDIRTERDPGAPFNLRTLTPVLQSRSQLVADTLPVQRRKKLQVLERVDLRLARAVHPQISVQLLAIPGMTVTLQSIHPQ